MPRSARKHQPSKETLVAERYFEGMPVVDSTGNLRVFVNGSDIAKAVRHDPTQCVFAQACKRLFGSKTVVFLRSRAYVDLADENGSRRVERFILDRAAMQRIAEFDRTGKCHPGGILFRAPTPSYTLDAKRAYIKKRRQGLRDGTLTMGPKKASPSKDKSAVIHGVLDDGVRHGSGLVQFIAERKAS